MDEPIVWRGQTMDDRSAERRAQLLDVGFDMIGTHGAPSVTLRAVCREAGLSPRYFYESFADREELLTAVYDHAEAGLLARLVPANEAAPKLSIREIIDICAEYFEEDPRRARTLLREPLSDDVLRAHQAGRSPAFLSAIIPALGGVDDKLLPRDSTELSVLAAALAGVSISLYLEWLDGRIELKRDELAEMADRLVTAIAEVVTTRGEGG
jgi:AcrR family transcriptional regulator